MILELFASSLTDFSQREVNIEGLRAVVHGNGPLDDLTLKALVREI